jgi:hypothetical protein
MPDRKVTLGEYMAGRVGLLKGSKVAAFIVAWGIYIEAQERPHTLDGYAAYWGQSLSTTYRERDLFRICWPGMKDPTELLHKIHSEHVARIDAKKRDVSAARLLSVSGSWE